MDRHLPSEVNVTRMVDDARELGSAELEKREVGAEQIELPLRVPVCAWCRPPELGRGFGAISHGICPRHLRQLLLEIRGR